MERAQKIPVQKIGKIPVVVLPLADYEKMKEDIEILSSKKLYQDIRKAREEVRTGKVFTLEQVKQRLRLR